LLRNAQLRGRRCLARRASPAVDKTDLLDWPNRPQNSITCQLLQTEQTSSKRKVDHTLIHLSLAPPQFQVFQNHLQLHHSVWLSATVNILKKHLFISGLCSRRILLARWMTWSLGLTRCHPQQHPRTKHKSARSKRIDQIPFLHHFLMKTRWPQI
jgi:hypothetical protein